ncbi:MAG: DNRLRE domain-containing protein [Pirellulales bacterium]|nr:DNRLRE domain-containing protein [Pirellulales bacterium]
MFRRVMTGVLVLAAVTCIATVHADTIVLQDGLNGYAGTDDTSFWTAGPDNNYGARNTLDVGHYYYSGSQLVKSLIRFDLSSIPTGSTVNGATLSFTTAVSNSATVTNELFRVLPANTGWVEGAGTGTPASSGEPCWNYHGYNTVPWAGSAGLSTADTDYAAAALDVPQASGAIGNTVTFTFNDVSFFNGPGGWLANPLDNAGFLFQSVPGTGSGQWTYNQYHSSEGTTVALRPVLTLDVTPIPEPSTLALLATGLIGLLCYAWR